MGIRAVVFDFDGLILETEEPLYVAYRELWARHELDLTLEEWAECIGTIDGFDPIGELQRRTGRSIDEAVARRQVSARSRALIDDAEILPGVLDWVTEAEAAGLGVAIASSSPREWIFEHLERHGHLERFPIVCCYDDVGVAKPEPDAYIEACRRLQVAPVDAVAIEDSAHGVAAAKAAGLRCVAVPTAMTRHLDFSPADLVVESLAHVRLADVMSTLG